MDPVQTELLVVGAGPGGYAAAFYAADLGKKVILVERENRLGGVCLNRGCMPSKALLNVVHTIVAARESAHRGVTFARPQIELAKLRAWKDSILQKLASGIAQLARARGVRVMQGYGFFEDSQILRVETASGRRRIKFDKAIIAVGSRSALPQAFDLGNPHIMTSRQALVIEDVPETLLVVGGGYIGMELGTVYAALGSEVTLVEALDSILPGADFDLSRPVTAYAEKAFKELRLSANVRSMTTCGDQIKVAIEYRNLQWEELYDRVLVAVGRVPNCEKLGLENTKVRRDERGFIKVNNHLQTDDPNLSAIGDGVGGVMLVHKAHKEARIAVDAIWGRKSVFENVTTPAIVFTDPEVAWCGLTETEAKQRGTKVQVARFPWVASGRAQTNERTEGLTKIIVDPETERVLGVGVVGHGASELIAEGVLAVQMGVKAKNLAGCVHPHPTLSETLMEAADAFYGQATHTVRQKLSAQKPTIETAPP